MSDLQHSIVSPLAGRRIIITRAAEQCVELCRILKDRGANPVVVPLVQFAPPDDFAPFDAALRNLQKFNWIFFTSANAVRAFADRLKALGLPVATALASVKMAAVGPATAQAAAEAGFHVAYVAKKHQGVALAEELAASLPNQHVLLPRSDRANSDLPDALCQLNAKTTEVVAYRTLLFKKNDAALVALFSQPDSAILLFSPSAVHGYAEIANGAAALPNGQNRNVPVIVAIGPVTAAALRSIGLNEILQSSDTTVDAVVQTLESHFAAKEHLSETGAKRG